MRAIASLKVSGHFFAALNPLTFPPPLRRCPAGGLGGLDGGVCVGGLGVGGDTSLDRDGEDHGDPFTDLSSPFSRFSGSDEGSKTSAFGLLLLLLPLLRSSALATALVIRFAVTTVCSAEDAAALSSAPTNNSCRFILIFLFSSPSPALALLLIFVSGGLLGEDLLLLFLFFPTA